MNIAQDELNKRMFMHFSFNHSNPQSNYFKAPIDTLNNKLQMIDILLFIHCT